MVSHRPSPPALVLIVVAVVALAVAAAAPSPPSSPPSHTTSAVQRYAFSHAEHGARDPASTCVDCHEAKGAADGRPAQRSVHCARCHDEIPAVLSRALTDRLAVSFVHAPHAALECGTCHANAPIRGDDDSRAEHTTTVTSARCLACHAGSDGAPREQACARCHGRDERKVAPSTHATTWRASHGARVLALAPSMHGASCTLCHKESSCRGCHRLEKPADHTVVWGERMHGVRAAFDRQRCQTCHETGQCIGCHRTTEPANHRGAWKATHGLVARSKSDASCQACHRASFCLDCHRGAR